MLLTVFCLRRDRSELTFSLQVDADFELQNFRALCELESGIPAAESQVRQGGGREGGSPAGLFGAFPWGRGLALPPPPLPGGPGPEGGDGAGAGGRREGRGSGGLPGGWGGAQRGAERPSVGRGRGVLYSKSPPRAAWPSSSSSGPGPAAQAAWVEDRHARRGLLSWTGECRSPLAEGRPPPSPPALRGPPSYPSRPGWLLSKRGRERLWAPGSPPRPGGRLPGRVLSGGAGRLIWGTFPSRSPTSPSAPPAGLCRGASDRQPQIVGFLRLERWRRGDIEASGERGEAASGSLPW